MEKSALLAECHNKLASTSAVDAQAAISLLESEEFKDDPSVSFFGFSIRIMLIF
jgi:hypothetical protein